VTAGQGLTGYEKDRSDSMAFGEVSLAYDGNMSWGRLVEVSQMKSNRPKIEVKVSSIDEIERFPATPLIFSATPNGIVVNPEEERLYRQSAEALQKTVAQRLKSANQKDVILFIHGFNVSFDNAVLSLNDIWHFSGRHGVPIAYSWPSGSGNLFGYFTDRESGEFTVYHLKETLRILSAMPEVENIHILAHSRGTDITTTALRELVIETRASGKNPRTSLKVKNLILAAPDLDYGVVTQRLIAEKFGPAFGQITIYMNQDDSALGISQALMKGIRFGRLTANEQNEREAQIFRNVKNVSFVNVKGVKGFVGHGYFSQHPGALSDIITLIKTSSPPGTSVRPLTNIEGNFWTLDRTYLNAELPIF
jgi:esterase/lipase superfamily enzyme